MSHAQKIAQSLNGTAHLHLRVIERRSSNNRDRGCDPAERAAVSALGRDYMNGAVGCQCSECTSPHETSASYPSGGIGHDARIRRAPRSTSEESLARPHSSARAAWRCSSRGRRRRAEAGLAVRPLSRGRATRVCNEVGEGISALLEAPAPGRLVMASYRFALPGASNRKCIWTI